MKGSTMAIKQADPGPSRVQSGKTNWREVFTQIRDADNAGWFEVGEFPASYVTNIKKGRFAGSEAGEFEATMRDTDGETQRGRLFVRLNPMNVDD